MIKRMKRNVLLTVLIQNLSHQIRTPLSIITGFADMLNDAIATQSKSNAALSKRLMSAPKSHNNQLFNPN